jgi:hypothetical protein
MTTPASLAAPLTNDPSALDWLTEDLPLSWIHESLAATGTESERERRLPAHVAALLVIAMGVLRDRSIVDVANDLALARHEEEESAIASNAISGARKRLGEAPLEHLAQRCAKEWAMSAAAAHAWRGLTLFGLDGSTLRVPDSDPNRAFFGGQSAGASRGASGYPLVRIVILMALRTHLLAGLAMGPYVGSSELSLTPSLIAQVPNESLLIVDRNFLSARWLHQHARQGPERYWLLRAKSNTRWRVVRTWAPGDELVEMEVSPEARKRDPLLPMVWRARAIRYHRRGFRPSILLTSLDDPARWPAREIVALYHERWELELGLDELKTEQMEREETLRSKTPWGVRQEIWGLMIGYNLVRRRAQDYATEQKVAPLRVSFVVMLRQLRDRWIVLAIAGSGAASQVRAHERRLGRRAVLPRRRSERQYPRAVKLKMSPYLRKRTSLPGARGVAHP